MKSINCIKDVIRKQLKTVKNRKEKESKNYQTNSTRRKVKKGKQLILQGWYRRVTKVSVEEKTEHIGPCLKR